MLRENKKKTKQCCYKIFLLRRKQPPRQQACAKSFESDRSNRTRRRIADAMSVVDRRTSSRHVVCRIVDVAAQCARRRRRTSGRIGLAASGRHVRRRHRLRIRRRCRKASARRCWLRSTVVVGVIGRRTQHCRRWARCRRRKHRRHLQSR